MSENTSFAAASDKIVPLHQAHQTSPDLPTPHTVATTLAATPRVEHLRHAGQIWSLTKRATGQDAPWYIVFERRGVRVRESMHTSSLPHAKVEARAFLDRWLDGQRRPKKPTAATVADVQAALSLLTIKAALKTRLEYFANFQRCLVHALNVPREQLGSVRLDALTDEAAARFFAWVETEAVQLAGQAAQNRFRRSWLSMFESSLALFADRAEYQLRKTLGLVLPDLRDWRNAAKNHGPHLPRDMGANVPDDATIKRTLREWAKLGNTPGYICRNREHRVREQGRTHFVPGPMSELDRRNMFLAIGLELSCGLRKSESPKARWTWRKVFKGVPHLSELDVDVKNATGQIHVVPVDPFWNFMLRVAQRNGWLQRAAGVSSADQTSQNCQQDVGSTFLIARPNEPGKHTRLQYTVGGHTDATYWPFVHIGWFLRDLGWATMKTNHALRDFTASMLTMRYDLAAASAWCRHSDLKTTARSYNRFVTMAGKVNAKHVAWLRWAK